MKNSSNYIIALIVLIIIVIIIHIYINQKYLYEYFNNDPEYHVNESEYYDREHPNPYKPINDYCDDVKEPQIIKPYYTNEKLASYI